MYGKIVVAASLLFAFASAGSAQEGLDNFAGDWEGSGKYVRLNGDTVSVPCNLRTEGGSASLEMNGRCTALVFISRDLSANITAQGRSLSGHYSGPEGNGTVQGERAAKALNLSVQWEKLVRGDDKAEMKIELVGTDRLRLRTFDLDPVTKSKVAVTDLDLRRQ